MVLQKRLDYGFNGFQVPYTPRATRSARRRCSFKKRIEDDNHMCAFDLLASVARKLLLDKEGSPSSSNTSPDEDHCAVVKNTEKKELAEEFENGRMKIEMCDRAGCVNTRFGFASTITSDCSEKLGDQKSAEGKAKLEVETLASKVVLGPNGYNNNNTRVYGDCKLEGETKSFINNEPPKTVLEGIPPALVGSDSSVKVSLCRNKSPHSLIPKSRDYVNVVSRDDDENSSGCTHPRAARRSSFRPTPRIGDRRIRKILASRYWKAAPKLKDEALSKSDNESKSIYHNRNNYYRSIRSERNYPIKKRRLYNYSSVSNYDRQISDENVSANPEGAVSVDVSDLCQKMQHGANGVSSSILASNKSFQSRDSHVKLRIKSFKVPELLIEIPETATVGSLKRRVMEAVTAILNGEVRVGVLLQGKKVRDDSKTLLQSGISHDNESDALGFSLEPHSSETRSTLCVGDSPFMLTCDSPQPLSRYLPSPGTGHHGTSSASPELPVANMGSFIESDHDSAPSPTTNIMSTDKSTKDSKALVPIPAMSVEALAVVPVHRKSKRSEIVQRRIRRPFSVAEVEALVQAVEKLGTGRWRDVKLRAFDNAKHRTYVDLKDKWKTLVHTARISPQQRRGEPVPQELLDRVLTAHAYWSQQQSKQQHKQLPQP